MRFDYALSGLKASIRLSAGLEVGDVGHLITSIAEQTDLLGRFDSLIVGCHGRPDWIFASGLGQL
jgi:hypothetical protein